jgi:hypothetical protein
MGRPNSFAPQAIFDVIGGLSPNNQTAMQSQRVISKSRSAVNGWPRSKDCFQSEATSQEYALTDCFWPVALYRWKTASSICQQSALSFPVKKL